MASSCTCTIPDDPFFHDLPPRIPVDPRRSSIQRGLDYLRNTQVTPEHEAALNGRDWSGNWPQYLSPEVLPALRIRDVSPFNTVFVHHSLALATEQNAETLQLTTADLQSARLMRRRAIQFLERFRAQSPHPDAGTYRFWPLFNDPARLDQCALLGWLLQRTVGGDVFHGNCAPINICTYPPGYLIPTDADTTANIDEALLTAARLDGGKATPQNPASHFENWRDLGQEPMRMRFAWMPNPTGAYLTWLADRGPLRPRTPQDVDLVVNGNVLFCLGRYESLDAADVTEAVALINQAVAEGQYQDISQVSSYYPDSLAFQYVISRAGHEGHVDGLIPAVQLLADELEAEAQSDAGGSVFWDRGNPSLNTAFAVLTLLNAGRPGPLTDGGAQFLRGAQDPKFGNWPEAPFFQGTSANGFTAVWTSSALTTAIALEALMRVQLWQPQPDPQTSHSSPTRVKRSTAAAAGRQ
jgi:hypothetical protein